MKRQFMNIVNWIGGLSCLGVVCGFFLPYIKLFFSGETFSLVQYVFLEMPDESLIEFIFILIVFAVSAGALFTFSSEAKLVSSVILLISAVVGKLLVIDIEKMTEWLAEKMIGASVLEWSYIGMICAGALAFAIAFINPIYEGIVPNVKSDGQEKRECPHCGKVFSREVSFCTNCGYPLGKVICQSCGKEGECGEIFCKNCGNKLTVLENREIACDETEEVICTNCGHNNLRHARFCTKCGMEIKVQL